MDSGECSGLVPRGRRLPRTQRICIGFEKDGPAPGGIEGDRVTGHETSHDLAERGRAGAQEKVKMVWDQGPGVALGLRFFEDAGEPFQERPTIFVVEEDLSSFDSPGHDVLEEAGGV